MKRDRIVLVAGLVAIAAACAPVVDPSGSPTRPASAVVSSQIAPTTAPTAADTWGPLAVVPPQGGSDGARAEGILTVTESCVVIVTAGEPTLLLWPADRSVWDADQQVVRFTNIDGSTVAAGDGSPVFVGGSGDNNEEFGSTTQEWLASTTWVKPPGEACPLEERWWVGALGIR